MRPIAGTVDDIVEKLETLGLPPRQKVVVSFVDTAALDALRALQEESVQWPISDAEFMAELDIDAEECGDLIGRAPPCSPMIRTDACVAVIDSNVFVSAVLNPESSSAVCVGHLLAEGDPVLEGDPRRITAGPSPAE